MPRRYAYSIKRFCEHVHAGMKEDAEYFDILPMLTAKPRVLPPLAEVRITDQPEIGAPYIRVLKLERVTDSAPLVYVRFLSSRALEAGRLLAVDLLRAWEARQTAGANPG